MDKKTHGGSESEGPGEGAEIIATGDAILLSRAIDNLADSFRGVANALRQLTPDAEHDDETVQQGRYLDGSPVKR